MRQDERRHIRLECISLSDQCETWYYLVISLFNEMRDAALVRMSPILGKGDVHTRGASRIWSRAPRFQAQRSLSPQLANFCPCALSHSAITLITIAPPPPAILNPGPGARHRLIIGPRVRRHLNPSLRAHRHHPLPHSLDPTPFSLR
jgi:hypothetical protein